MSREREGFRDQLVRLEERFGGAEVVTLNECAELMRLSRNALLRDRTFPAKKVSGRYLIPVVQLARWMTAVGC